MFAIQSIRSYLIACLILLFPGITLATSNEKPITPTITAIPQGEYLYDRYPYAVLYYYGITCDDALGQMLAGQFHRWPEHIQSIEITRTLSRENFLRKLVYPLVGVVEISANFTVRNGSNEH